MGKSKLSTTIAARVPHEVKAVIEKALTDGNSKMRPIMTDLASKIESGAISLQDGHIIINGGS